MPAPVEFELAPYVGALPLRFGLNPREVEEILGEPVGVNRFEDGESRLEFEPCFCYFDAGGKLREIVFFPETASLRHRGIYLLRRGVGVDPTTLLLELDSAPKADVGIMVFFGVGVAISGFQDGKTEQMSLNVFRDDVFGDLR